MKKVADKMKMKFKAIAFVLLLLLTLTCAAGCSGEATPYQENDSEDYKVSVKFDANGGIFTTNTSVIVDSFNISDLPKNSQGDAEIALISPDNALRGKGNAFAAVNSGYYLAGWYAQREEATDAQGNTVYTYADKWDFESDLLAVDPGKKYSSKEPVLTLYAAWVPAFQVEIYDLDSGDLLDSYAVDPEEADEIQLPAWDLETGTIEMYDFPERSGYTFVSAYYDVGGTQPVESASIAHPGVINYDNGTVQEPVLQLYVDWMEGDWYHIYTAKQFVKNASVNGCYVIHEDLDFAEENWPTSFMHGNFKGTIQGNGHVFKNISITQTNNSKVNGGLFGYITEEAEISDLTFENATFTIKAGTRVTGTCYGLLAGTVSADAKISNLQILSSQLQIDSACYFGVSDYSIGLVCGMGSVDSVDASQISCTAVGEKPENVIIEVSDNTVTVNIVSG